MKAEIEKGKNGKIRFIPENHHDSFRLGLVVDNIEPPYSITLAEDFKGIKLDIDACICAMIGKKVS